ncbi:MAG TPA: hypothetical protein PLI09_20195 [Candidatus Hydrogenedentes bacterium]|nr:hypothetical protein [Candidatus Hydrogenedentota bacterium]
MTEIRGQMQLPDYLMLAGYFVLMLGVGGYFYRYMKGIKDYFSGSNSIPWWLSGVSFYMTSFSVAAFVFYPSLCYRYGFVGITLMWITVPATLFSAGLFAKRWRRARIDSPVEYLETRFGPALRQVFAWQGIPVIIIDDAIKLLATGTFVSICTGLPKSSSIILCGGIMLVYTFMGGLWAVAVTDFIQFIVLGIGLMVILPLSIGKAGGITAILNNSPEGFFNFSAPEFPWSYILPLILLYALSWSVNWALVQRYYCVPREKDALKVGWMVMALYTFGPPLMFFPAIAARQFLPQLSDAGDVYPTLCAQLLPAGMLGLAIAAMFAATMSTLSGHYNVCSSVLTNDVYRRLIRPGASQWELVQIGRLMTIVIGVIALGVSLIMAQGKAEDLFRIMVTLFSIATAPVAIPMIIGLVSRRFNSFCAMTGFFFGIILGLGLFALSRYNAEVSFLGLTWKPETEDILFGHLALKMEIVMLLGTALFTFTGMLMGMALGAWIKPMTQEEQSRIDAFIQRVETPIGQLESDDAIMRESGFMLSPFRVVGVCLIAIALMMMAVVPWAKGLAFAVDLGLSLVLLIIGGILFKTSRSNIPES